MVSSVTISGRLFKIRNLYTLYDLIEIIIYNIILFIPNIMFSFSFYIYYYYWSLFINIIVTLLSPAWPLLQGLVNWSNKSEVLRSWSEVTSQKYYEVEVKSTSQKYHQLKWSQQVRSTTNLKWQKI